MQITGLTWEQIEQAAYKAGVRARGDVMHCTIRTKPTECPTCKGFGWIKVSIPTPKLFGYEKCPRCKGHTTLKSPPRWRKIGSTGRTVPGAVCWHGHRAFMRGCFAINPDARIKSCLADYRGREHFEATHAATFGGSTGWGEQGRQCDCGA